MDGWAYVPGLTLGNGLAQANAGGINLRSDASISASLIVLVPAVTIMIVTRTARGQYVPVRVSRAAAGLPDPTPRPPADMALGWARSQNITINARRAIVGPAGTNLPASADQNSAKLSLVKEDSVTVVVGPACAAYIPIWARKDEITSQVNQLPTVDAPDLFLPPHTVPDTTPGWALTTQLTATAQTAVAGQYGLKLRQAPRNDATAVGFIPGNGSVAVTGQPQGEYTPVLVDNKVLQPPFGTASVTTTGPTSTPATASPAVTTPAVGASESAAPHVDPQPLGHFFIGLHASADPSIPEPEYQEISNPRPGIIRVLPFRSDSDIAHLAPLCFGARRIVRDFLDFGDRRLNRQDFMQGTLSDVQGALRVLPGVRFIYPGLSPGSTVTGLKLDHIQFA